MTDAPVAAEEVAASPARFPQRFGVHLTEEGVDVVVHAPQAGAVRFCTFDGPNERQVKLLAGAHGTWTAHVPGVGAGTRYGFRTYGEFSRQAGRAFNPAKLLLDPYARGIVGEFTNAPESYPGTDSPDLRWAWCSPLCPRYPSTPPNAPTSRGRRP